MSKKLYPKKHLGLLIILVIFCSCKTSKFQEKTAYLYTYFKGNDAGEEAIHFAVSPDGYNYYALNNNEPILQSEKISHTGGVRDPHILRTQEGGYYMVATDLYSKNGWNNTAIVLMKSDDLTNWTTTVIDIPQEFPEPFPDVNRVWAPQTIYDLKKDAYMIYFSMLQPGSYDKIYYSYVNDGFTELMEKPKQLFFNPTEKASIDGDIIEKDGKYHLFYKTEGQEDKGIKVAVSDVLTSGYKPLEGNVDQTEEAVEGSSVFKRIDSDKYMLMYDRYVSDKYQFAESTNLKDFKIVDAQVSMNFHPRHGSLVTITEEETAKLLKAFPSENLPKIITAEAPQLKSNNIVIDDKKATVYLPVKQGTNLSSFDPEFKTFPGIKLSPEEAQDFTGGPVAYTATRNKTSSETYEVVAEVANNPVLEGYYADPEILYSEKTGKYYLYPTSDGFHLWTGTSFKVFSSEDLVNWEDEGIILDLKEDVSWTDRNAWAPTIAEKKINGEYKYFYYYTAAQLIGVAVADNPIGPFTDIGSPLLDELPVGVNGGMTIDPDVFTDPQSGKSYLYWGNGFMAVAELNEDMVSIKEGTTKVITPDATFREGAEVFYRNNTYYFLWSEDDTRSPNYRVRYATSATPTGPLTIPKGNMVLQKNEAKQIYATGHNSVINITGTDTWYIIYHRFTRPKGKEMGASAGFHREVSIDKLTFTKGGQIIPVDPSLEGIQPINK